MRFLKIEKNGDLYVVKDEHECVIYYGTDASAIIQLTIDRLAEEEKGKDIIGELLERLKKLEERLKEIDEIWEELDDLRSRVEQLENKVVKK
jgi:hypothetical protein